MAFLIALLVIVLVLGGAFWLSFGLLGLLMTLVVAGLVGWAADAIVPGRLPGGWIGAVLAGLAGGFIGQFLFSALSLPTLGLSLAGVSLVPAFVGALLIAGAAELVSNSRALPSGSR
jgi:uncharacterized membrane protein YeaQ/YmgE (transglycosylase-associated protein family)